MNDSIVIGITGGIGSGKSTLCIHMESLGYKVYDCDRQAKRLINEDETVRNKIMRAFGEDAYGTDGKLDSRHIADIVFEHPQILKQLESIVHPAVKVDIRKWIADNKCSIMFIESAILFESGLDALCDFTVNITAGNDGIRRAALRDGKSKEEILKRTKNQMTDQERAIKTDLNLINPYGQPIEITANKIIQHINKLKTMKKTRIAIVGYGNIGRAAIEAVHSAPDMELAGIVRRSIENIPQELANHKVVASISELEDVDVALLCTPTREVPRYAAQILALGISTVDSFDIHGGIADLRASLEVVAQANNAVAIVSAGWDPGSDSVMRCLMQAMAPKGITYTNFGPGRSMGHSVAARAIEGVEDALSMTIPLGTGIHRRMVYVKVKEGHNFETIKSKILADDYFCHDETHVIPVDSVDTLNDVGHGVNMVRKGVSGNTHNQRFEFNMSINNPALTAQIMVACARAAKKLTPGAYTMIEIPPIDLLPGNKTDNIRKLV